MPLISLIIPVYNDGKHILQLVDSLFDQDTSLIEIIIIDDGSKDDTFDLLQECQRLHPSLQVLHQANAGAGAARNCGLAIAHGHYVTFIDSDDTITSEYLSTLRQYAEYDADLVQFNWYEGTHKKGYSLHETGLEVGICSPEQYSKFLINQKANMPWCRLYRLATIREAHAIFDSTMTVGEDIAFMLETMKSVKSILISNKAIYRYKWNPHGLCSNVKPKYFYDNSKIYHYMLELIEAKQLSIDYINLARISMVGMAFRVIGSLVVKQYNHTSIADHLFKSSILEIIEQSKASIISDRIKKFLIVHSMYHVIGILLKLKLAFEGKVSRI